MELRNSKLTSALCSLPACLLLFLRMTVLFSFQPTSYHILCFLSVLCLIFAYKFIHCIFPTLCAYFVTTIPNKVHQLNSSLLVIILSTLTYTDAFRVWTLLKIWIEKLKWIWIFFKIDWFFKIVFRYLRYICVTYLHVCTSIIHTHTIASF